MKVIRGSKGGPFISTKVRRYISRETTKVSLMYELGVGTGNSNDNEKDNKTFFSEVPVI